MNQLLYSITGASIAALVVLVSTGPVCANDPPTSDPGQTMAGQEPGGPSASPQEAKGIATAKVNVDNEGIILKGYDAVAYFKQGKPVNGDPAIRSTYQGATYLFASAADKADFDRDPAKYAPRYGAFCSYGVAIGVLADIDAENAFAIYKGKLYLCGNEAVLKDFKSDIDSNIEKADANWLHLAGP
jgi:YHS domain-containing protein